MFTKQRIILLCILLVAVNIGANSQVRHYSPGPPPAIGDIQSLCVAEYPAPRNRTVLGIGEEAACWIDPKTWRDTDICTDAEGKQTEVADSLSEVVWSVNGVGTVYPIVTDGSSVTLTADSGGEDDTATVIATVRDSGTMGQDLPIEKRKVFNVLIPKGFRIIPTNEQPPAKKAGDGK